MEGPQPTLGTLLRQLRTRNGWTLRDMSLRSGIPVSTLSKIENDHLSLTYEKLLKLSQRLQIPVGDLFAQPGQEEDAFGMVNARRSIGRKRDAIEVTTPNYVYHYFCPELRRKRMLPILTRVRSRSMADFGEYMRHAGEEYIYVLEGRIVVHTEYYDPVALEAGESIYLDSNMGHAYLVGEGCDEALVLGVCAAGQDLAPVFLASEGRREDATRAGGDASVPLPPRAAGARG